MFKSWWQCMTGARGPAKPSTRRESVRRRNRVVLGVESLEGRLTPSNVSAVVSGSTLTLTKVSGDDSLTIVNGPAFGELNVTTSPGNTINNNGTSFTTQKAISRLMVELGAGNDSLTFDGTVNGAIDLTGSLSIQGMGGNKSISLNTVNLLNAGSLNVSLMGNGTETSLFTDVNVGGAAVINHPGVGNTSFTITTSGSPSPNTVFNWGSLLINNGQGSDVNAISDTNFAGNVTINNGLGEAGNTGLDGGSFTNISATNDQNLTTIGGSVKITTAGGESDSELYDYNVHGNVLINTGPGIAGQTVANFVGVENIQSFGTSGVPVIGGSVIVNGSATAGASPGLVVSLGTGITQDTNPNNMPQVTANLPLIVHGEVFVTASGPGSVLTQLNDLRVGGPVAVQLAGGNDTVDVGTADGPVSATAGIIIASTGGNKTVAFQNVADGGFLDLFLLGNGTETSTFFDVSVAGAAVVNHPGSGDTSFTVASSGNTASPNAVFKWGSLNINNGQGMDTSLISDTDFAGNVAIGNGAGGSFTNISAANDQNVTTIGGNVTITTTSGHSDSEIYDNDVNGNVAINTGSGSSGTPNFVGVENIQSFDTSGIPFIGGSVTINGVVAAGNIGPGLVIDFGTGIVQDNQTAANLPLTIAGNLTINASGSGAAAIDLNDLSVPNGTTMLNLGTTTSGDMVQVQASSGLTSVFSNFSFLSQAGGANTFSLQDGAGALQFGGAVNVNLGPGADTLNLAADSGNSSGVSDAVIDFFAASAFNGGKGTNALFKGAVANLFFFTSPMFVHF